MNKPDFSINAILGDVKPITREELEFIRAHEEMHRLMELAKRFPVEYVSKNS